MSMFILSGGSGSTLFILEGCLARVKLQKLSTVLEKELDESTTSLLM